LKEINITLDDIKSLLDFPVLTEPPKQNVRLLDKVLGGVSLGNVLQE
jgi:hypothetical protein